MSIYLGIDFGTSTNYIVRWDLDKKIIKEEPFGDFGESNVVDNVIYYTNTEKVIGDPALRRGTVDPLNMVKYIKREIDNDNWTTHIKALNKDITSKDITTDIFREIRKKVESNHGGEIIEGAVISVPFAFLYKERQKIKKAAMDAGINVLGLIEEPVAAAIRSLDFKENLVTDNKKILMVFDFGGGTLDVTIFSCFKDNDIINLEVLNTTGDKHLGGKDITLYLVDYLLKSINLDITSLNKNSKIEILNELSNMADDIKEEISENGEADIFFNMGEFEIEKEINEEEFENIIINKGIKGKIKDILEESVYEIDLKIEDIDDIILIGGSSKLSIVKKIIKEIFEKEPVEFEEPNRLVGEGAAIYCGNILDNNLKYNITHRLSQSIGREKDGQFYPMINKNSIYGVKSNLEKIYIGNKKEILIDIYQGNSYDIKKCSKIGCIKIIRDDIKHESIQLELELDENCVIKYYIYTEDDTLKRTLVCKGELSNG